VTDTAPGEAIDPLAPGVEIGPYRVVGPLGRGGMGIVVEARHVRVGQRAALKLLAPDRRAAVGPAAVRRFLAEVDVLCRLDHPGLVHILDCGEAPVHGPWLAMELIAGEPLRAHLDRAAGAPLPLPFAVRTVRRLASAVAAIHQAGIVHRDLKPDNVMIVPDPR
jgi:serine/threonine protein kinase